MGYFDGKVVAVTGAASGIGKAVAQVLHARGASLALSDINIDQLKGVAEGLTSQNSKQKVTTTKLDVTKTDEVNDWITSTVRDLGQLNGAANIAGLCRAYRRNLGLIMSVNATGVFKCIRAELQHMSDGGAIVNAASVAGLTGNPNVVAYNASKHAVVGMTMAAAKEGGPRQIRVNAIAPGYVDTPLLDNSGLLDGNEEAMMKMVPQGRKASAEEVAKLVAYLLSDEASYVNGNIARIDGGWRS
ncbi:hypothetical protein LTR70_002133 [Exophiala xenobiotica]|uniref:Uncharacterized protein n=1 Tax=Lithohypha guttulata TaxID=1690604 RepID=A0ABR0K365_9EURO|nr:hypothetical protein LTR24_007370 [Lithohypha guttulata]KAK5326133.1 hypothetical protein LTR70_002133 [Exophiala xenobiotica]